MCTRIHACPSRAGSGYRRCCSCATSRSSPVLDAKATMTMVIIIIIIMKLSENKYHCFFFSVLLLAPVRLSTPKQGPCPPPKQGI